MPNVEKDLRFTVTALLTASMICLVSAVAMFFLRQTEIDKRVALEKKIEDLDMEKARLSKEFNEAMAAQKDLEKKADAAEEKAKSIERQLDEEKKQKESLFSQLDSERKESKRLANEFSKLKDERERLAASVEDARNECDGIKAQLATIQQAKEIVEGRLKEILERKEVELERIVVKPAPGASAQTIDAPFPSPAVNASPGDADTAPGAAENGSRGEVLVVNKKFDFVVVNLGDDNGVKPGTDLGVYRNKQMLAMLKVEKVHANMSAAKIPPEWKNVDIKEGDTVVIVK